MNGFLVPAWRWLTLKAERPSGIALALVRGSCWSGHITVLFPPENYAT